MAKLFAVVVPNDLENASTRQTKDWKKCVMCQEDTTEMLQSPFDSTRHDTAEGVGYKTLAENLSGFDKIGGLLGTLKLSRIDEGQGIEAMFRVHRAKFHDYCRLKYNKTKLQRAEKRKAPTEDNLVANVYRFTRQSKEQRHLSMETCFFCDNPYTICLRLNLMFV